MSDSMDPTSGTFVPPIPFRTPTGNRIIAGIGLLIVLAALGFAFAIGAADGVGIITIIATITLVAFGLASAYTLITGRSEGDIAIKGVSQPRMTRTIGFAAVATAAIVFILLAVFGSDGDPSRDVILLNGVSGYLFVYILSVATIAQAQIMRERAWGDTDGAASTD